MADDPHIEVHEWAPGEGPEVQTATSPWCAAGEHFDCPGIKIEEGKLPMVCTCRCHLLAEVI
jgi:hypothetical protein